MSQTMGDKTVEKIFKNLLFRIWRTIFITYLPLPPSYQCWRRLTLILNTSETTLVRGEGGGAKFMINKSLDRGISDFLYRFCPPLSLMDTYKNTQYKALKLALNFDFIAILRKE